MGAGHKRRPAKRQARRGNGAEGRAGGETLPAIRELERAKAAVGRALGATGVLQLHAEGSNP